MIIGVGLDGRLNLSLDELRSCGEQAARLGFESLWTPAPPGAVPDAFHVCSAWHEATHAIVPSMRTAIGVVPAPRTWRVESLAAQAATLGMLSNNHFVLGIGIGNYGDIGWQKLGLPNRPIGVMASYLDVLRSALVGESVSYDGPGVFVESLKLPAANVPVYLATLGPQMLRLAGGHADGASLNWASPEHIAWSREHVAAGAEAAGRDPKDTPLAMYIRVCIDDDVEAARRALGFQTLSYALARPGVDPALGYRGHFARMGFDAALSALEARRTDGVSLARLVDHAPDELLQAVGYYGSAGDAPKAFARLCVGLDEAIVRVITARPGIEPVLEAMRALTPQAIRAAK